MNTTISTGRSGVRALLLVAGLAGSLPSPCHAQDAPDVSGDVSVTVHLAGGRSLSAAIEPADDAEHLWLRWQRGKAVLLRAVAWGQVLRADVGEEDLDRDQLRRLVDRLYAQQAAEDEPSQPIATVSRPKMIGTTAPAVEPSAGAEARVRSLSVDAYAANFDADVEVDGLVLEVMPLDAQGRAVAVHGTLQVELIGQSASLAARRGQSLYRLGYWSRPVEVEDFGSYGATLRLPFTQVHPEFDTNVAAMAAVHVTLSVPGQGSFESTDAMVRVRPYSVVRDRYQQRTDHRFFPQERTGDGRR